MDKKTRELIKLIGKETIGLREDLLGILQTQEEIVKLVMARLPNLSPEERALFRAASAKVETILEHEGAAIATLKASFEELMHD